ncbi:MAG: DUF928 domain-containing protein [Leptolyngbyaceae bacterium]|nr:DUF928 domain-containing protein [Leptolyngbyaceae bacterium]
MYSLNPTLKSHPVRLMRRMMAIALFAGTLYTSMAGVALAQYTPPNDIGLPSRREPGGTRGGCLGSSGVPVDGLGLTPLMPTVPAGSQDTTADDPYFGQTLSPYPTFYWYVPAITARAAEFVLMDENDNEVYTSKFQLEPTDAGGLISLSLPENAGLPPLEVDKNYRWYFSLICDEFDRGTDIFTEGWVRRVPSATLPLVDELATLPPSAQANVYAEASLWFEALDVLAKDKRMHGMASSEWTALLESVGLADFTQVVFLQ